MTSRSETTPNLQMPMILPGQTLRYISHNEALVRLDACIQISVVGIVETLPLNVQEGQRFLLTTGELAVFQASSWHLITPNTGWLVWREDVGRLTVFDGDDWNFVTDDSHSRGAYDQLAVGTESNSINRFAVSSPASLFTHAGTDHRIVVNKAATGHTASLVFQSNFSGRAEIGLTGDEALSFKVSPDGQQFTEALRIDPATGIGRFSVPDFPDGSDDFTINDHTVTLSTKRPIELYYLRINQDSQLDELHSINGGLTGQILILQIPGSAIDVILKDSVGNLNLAGDLTLARPSDMIMLVCRNGTWHELSRSDN